jgi:predicted membrane-bound mannosyltransferase
MMILGLEPSPPAGTEKVRPFYSRRGAKESAADPSQEREIAVCCDRRAIVVGTVFRIERARRAIPAGNDLFSNGQGVSERQNRPPRSEETSRALASAAAGTALREARAFAHEADERGDAGTNDLLVSDVIRTNEMQAWFLAEYLVDGPLVRGNQGD